MMKMEKKKKKLEFLVCGLKVVQATTSSGHKQTHLCYTTTIPVICSLLHSHTMAGGDTGRISPYLLSAYCLRSCWEKGHFDLILGDSFFLKKKTV